MQGGQGLELVAGRGGWLPGLPCVESSAAWPRGYATAIMQEEGRREGVGREGRKERKWLKGAGLVCIKHNFFMLQD